jgi:hypothetical protein
LSHKKVKRQNTPHKSHPKIHGLACESRTLLQVATKIMITRSEGNKYYEKITCDNGQTNHLNQQVVILVAF